MSLQFVMGGAGSGKTRYLYETAIQQSLKQPERSFLFIVPEQYTMQTQKELVHLHPRHGLMNMDVLSFKRLAYRVFEDLGVQVPAVLDDMGKSMVLRKVAGRLKKELGLYGGHLEQPGFISQLKSQISELSQYGVGPEELNQVEEETDHPLLKEKLKDLQVIYRGFKEYIEDHYITSEEILDILCRELPRWEKLADSVIYLDGYTGFTPVQYRLAELFMLHARDVVCTVTVDLRENPYRECSIQHLFYMGRHTVCRLKELADRRHVEVKREVRCDRRPGWRFKDSESLDFLERNLYRYTGKVWTNETSDIQICQGKTAAEEAAYICTCISRLVREKGLRYRDMAVITGDPASYGRELSHPFDEAGIPYFMDQKKSILENPLVELIRAALETVKDCSYESVFRYLKTGLVYDRGEREALSGENAAADKEEQWVREKIPVLTDRLENYVRALGIRGWKQWEQTWDKPYRGGERVNLEELNAYRQWVLEPLKELREAFQKEEATISSVTAALRRFLEKMELKEKLEEYSDFFAGRHRPGDENLAKEYGQVYERVEELFFRLEGLLGDEKADRKNYIQILEAGFEEIRVGVIPATADQVIIGDLTRSRLESVKVLFFAGLNEGLVPQRKSGGSLLTDGDREVFRTFHMELAPTAREDGCIQKFYLYLMLSKPSRQLVLTWAAASKDGKSARPSSLIGEVKKLFQGLSQESCFAEGRPILTPWDGREMLIGGLREAAASSHREQAFLELYRRFYSEEAYQKQVKQLVDAAFFTYEDRGIGRAAARALYGQTLQGSVTRLEQFASCAYAHFLKYGLELMERQEYRLEAVDMGNLFHQSIDLCFRFIRDQKLDWSRITEAQRKALVKECVAQVTEQYGNTIMASSARNAYLAQRVERITDRTIWALAEQVKKGDFVPAGFEVSFSAIDDLRAMRIRLSEDEELQLKGRIDRLDLCEDEEHIFVKIIDYKSGNTSFDLAALYYGLQLQLVVYMDAALEMEERKNPGKQAVPAGIFYYNIKDPVAEKDGEMTKEDIEHQILRQLRMNGLVNSELDVIRHLDREIEKESDVIPVAMKDGYVQETRSSVAGARRFEELRAFVGRKLKTSGRQILEGETGLRPYKQGNRTACDYCPYHAVCGFDTKTAGYGFRRLKSMKAEEIWQEIEKEGENGSKMDPETEAGH